MRKKKETSEKEELKFEENKENEIKENQEVKVEKRINLKNISKLFIKLLFLTFLILLISNIIASVLALLVYNQKYGFEFLAEMFFAIIILVILLLSHNKKVLFEKRESIFKGMKYGITITVISVLIFISNIENGLSAGVGIIINLILYSTVIGMAEEFLCRGFLQNAFLKKYGKTTKGVYLSIIGSSLAFGMIHLINLVSGQTLAETFLQVIQTTSIGLLFGAIYYRTGNIWSTIFLHGFYDFAILLGESTEYVDCLTLSNPSLLNMMYGIITSILISSLYIVNTIKILEKEKVKSIINNQDNQNINKVRNNKYNYGMIAIALCLMIIPNFFEISDDYTVCYHFEEYELKDKYELRYNKQYGSFQIVNNYSDNKETLNFYLNEISSLIVENPETGDVYNLLNDVYDFEIVKANDKYVMLVEQETTTEYKKYYLEINERIISNDKEFLKSLKNNMIEIVTPEIYEMGYIYINDGEFIYPIIKSELNEIFVIKNAENIYILK